MTVTSVSPYWELSFDADGDASPRQLARLEREVPGADLTDLLFFAHGWNNDHSLAERLYERFLAPFPELAGAGVRLGYVGVFWPSMRFPDEPIPDFPHPAALGVQEPAPRLDARLRRLLGAKFPGRVRTVERIAQLLDEQPEDAAAYAEFVRLVRRLTSVVPQDGGGDTGEEADAEPGILHEDPALVFADLAAARERCGAEAAGLWGGAHELLRQAAYYAMKRRAGVVGERGLGPALGRLAEAAPHVRPQLAGHSFGARLVAYALRGLPKGRRAGSVTLLQGAFSHYAFADELPHDKGRGGALHGLQKRVAGPVTACHSKHDTALSLMYPLASRLARDSSSLLGGIDVRWGAVGHDGHQAVPGASRHMLAEAVKRAFAPDGCVSVDASSVVRRGGPPAGAHSDICHPELARVVLAGVRAGRA